MTGLYQNTDTPPKITPPPKRGRPPKDPSRYARDDRTGYSGASKAVQATPETIEAALIIQMDAFVDTETVSRLTTLSKTEIYRRVSENRFPKPHIIGEKRKAWQISQIRNWIQEQTSFRTPLQI